MSIDDYKPTRRRLLADAGHFLLGVGLAAAGLGGAGCSPCDIDNNPGCVEIKPDPGQGLVTYCKEHPDDPKYCNPDASADAADAGPRDTGRRDTGKPGDAETDADLDGRVSDAAGDAGPNDTGRPDTGKPDTGRPGDTGQPEVGRDAARDAQEAGRDVGTDARPEAGEDAGQPLECVVQYQFQGDERQVILRNRCNPDTYSLRLEAGDFQIVNGIDSQALALDGEVYLSGRGDLTETVRQALTVEVYFQPTQGDQSYEGAFGNLIVAGEGEGNDYNGFAMGIDARGAWFFLGVDGFKMTARDNRGALPTNQINHLVGKYDGDAVEFYVNGERVHRTEMAGNVSHVPNNPLFTIGADRQGNNAAIGHLYEVRVSDVLREL